MGLPKIDLPLFEVSLPSDGRKIKYRGFTVKEEKILLVAQESEDPTQEILATKQVLNNCIYDIDVSELAMFDLEYILLLLRARSVNNTLSFAIKDPDTGETVELEFDIDELELNRNPEHSNKIKINDDWTLFLKYPTIDEFINISEYDSDDPLVNYFVMTSCLDKVASEDEVHDFKDYSPEQIDEFMDNMSPEVIRGVQNFFTTMPRLRQEMKYTNKDGKEKTFVMEGMKTFFI
jgi:hypothetical protein